MKVLCLVPALPEDITEEAEQTWLRQTVPTTVLKMTKRVTEDVPIPQKISKVLNSTIAWMDLEQFDYLLRVDGDSVLPLDFAEKHIAIGAAVAGGAGWAQLINTRFFLQEMNGHFHRASDDTYTYFKAKACGCKTSDLIQPVKHSLPGAKHNAFRYNFYTGKLDYMIGFDPVHVLSWLRLKKAAVIRCVGYFWALLSDSERFEFARTEQNKYVKLLMEKIKP